MKALSLMQPWATAIMIGHKKIETRSWSTRHSGRIAIHASKGFPKFAREFAEVERALGRIPGRLPFGSIIGFANLVGMNHTESLLLRIDPVEKLYGDYSPGRWGWLLNNIEPLPDDEIISCKGSLGLWEVPAELGLDNL